MVRDISRQSNPRDPEHERADRQHADQLYVELAASRDANRQGSPDAGKQVDRNRANHVVQPELFQNFDTGDAYDAADGADDDRPVVIDDIGARGDRDKPRQRAVQTAEQVDPSENRARNQQGDDDTGRSGQVGVHEDVTHGNGVGRAAKGELRASVESEPAQPEDEDAQRHDQIRWTAALAGPSRRA